MTKEEAQKEVQRLLGEANQLVSKAEALMDEHRFSAGFLGKDYCPRDLTEEELDYDRDNDFPINRDWMGVGDGGEWMGSSDVC
jgi:hypothetical protein